MTRNGTPPPPQVTGVHFGYRAAGVAGLGIVALLAALNLPLPFSSDQALFTHIGLALHDGLRLYADVWDIKQPGLFALYELAGSLFGFSVFGIHTFDLPWNLALAVVVLWLAGQMTRTPLAILVQRNSWWEYHFDLYLIPLGTLGVAGLAWCWEIVPDPTTKRGWLAGGSDAVMNILRRDYVVHSKDRRDGMWCQRRSIAGPLVAEGRRLLSLQ